MTKKLILYSSFMILLLVLIIGIRSFTGSPKLKDQSKKIAIEYLQKNYPEESFTVDSVGYYPGEGTYIVHFISKDGTMQGNIDLRDGIIVEGGEEPFIEE